MSYFIYNNSVSRLETNLTCSNDFRLFSIKYLKSFEYVRFVSGQKNKNNVRFPISRSLNEYWFTNYYWFTCSQSRSNITANIANPRVVTANISQSCWIK